MQIAIINKTSTSIWGFTEAFNKYILTNFFPIWRRYFEVYQAITLPSEKSWKLYLWDEIKTPGALGQRVLREVPEGHVYLDACRQNWPEVLSHELLEMVINPFLNLEVARLQKDLVQLIPYEICDPVQGTTKEIDGYKLSNFVYPNYFVEDANGPFDCLNLVKRPFEILPTGYSTIIEVNKGSLSKRDVYSQNENQFVSRLRMRELQK